MGRFGLYLKALLMLVLMTGAAQAEEPVAGEPWQATITGQIEAFRAQDAPGAFLLAAAPFQRAFPTAEQFFAQILASGYGPIMESSSHSFGAFTELSPGVVAQQVTLQGTDLTLYEAIYLLTEEAAGWRVSGVQLVRTAALGI